MGSLIRTLIELGESGFKLPMSVYLNHEHYLAIWAMSQIDEFTRWETDPQLTRVCITLMSLAKSDKLGLLFPKELMRLPLNKSRQESRAETGASEAAREISSLKVGKMLLQQVDTRIFTNKKGIGRESLLVNFSFCCCHSKIEPNFHQSKITNQN